MKKLSSRPAAIVLGVLTMLVFTLGLAAVLAALIGSGLIPPGAMAPAAYGITGAGALLGALLCGKRAGQARLPLCLAACGIYLLLVFVLRGLVYRSVGAAPWIVPVCALTGCVLGAVLSSGQKRRRY